jgi:geranylgeranyl pyrophosphate synthase
MKVGTRLAPGSGIGSSAAARSEPRATDRVSVPGAGAPFATVWPRQFDLDAVKAILGEDADQVLAETLAASVNGPLWSLVDRGGQRWRPTISRLAFEVSGGTPPAPEPICQVAELLHTGSLIVDDIQDSAAERRGGPAAHTVYGVPTALNAANTAYFRALEVLRRTLPDPLRLRALDMLAEELFAAHLGQALDLALGARLQGGAIRVAHCIVLARAKTGALLRIAARLGAIAAAADPAPETVLGEWASEIAIAYQIRNDVDDLNAAMRDVATCRPTYPLLLLLEEGGSAAAALRPYLGQPTACARAPFPLRELFARARVVERSRAAARGAMGRALDSLRRLPAGEARDALERITRQLAGGPGES